MCSGLVPGTPIRMGQRLMNIPGAAPNDQ
jgi:hypothetical protein